ncbi:MAG: Fe-S protein assembly co-chaperone HscB [Bacteroidota bacterium]
MNYFELFDLPVSLQVDQSILPKKYFELQKKFHPDFFSQSSEDEQAEALERSSDINKAFKVFKNQDQTIKYVLQLKGLLEEEEKYQLPPDFLMEMMELNEDLNDNSRTQIEQIQNELYNEIKDIVENYDDSIIATDKLLKVKEYYFKKKYLHRILDRLAD